ncbi:MAG: hypothetical protein CW336_03605 [Bacteroidetes bacterium]|jgi:antitoxin component YwqK of YwqJK toxin-antitoxin module|nr:hypothetical protein [Bacteroidota bacterium]
MRNKIIYILLIINILFSCKEKDAPVVSYWDDGVLKSELRYKDGKLDGVCRWYYRNGKPEMEVTYSMDKLNGEATRWYENGNLEEKSYYKDNQYDGVVQEYNVFGTMVKLSTYENGVLNGLYYQWYDNGKQFMEGEYIDGMMHGSWLMYYQDGTIGSNAIYNMGTGVQKGYSEGGAYQNVEIHYKNNVKDGEEIHFNMDGSISEILVWDNGNYVGTKR